VNGRRSAGHDHLEVAREAGLGRVSLVSVVAGVLCAYGAFGLLAAIAGSIASAADAETDFRSNDWTSQGAAAALLTALVLLVAYMLGGYVAGRMARRSGLLNGFAVFVASIATGAIVGTVIGIISDNNDVRQNLRSIGVPTALDQVNDVAIFGLAASAAAMLIGAVSGSFLGERWHTKLARLAADPTIGPAADAQRAADREYDLRGARADNDELVRRDVRTTPVFTPPDDGVVGPGSEPDDAPPPIL